MISNINAMRPRLTYANVIATVALFLALSGGVVWAAGKIGTKRLKANSVTTKKIKRNAVTATKIRNGAVGFEKLAAGTNLVINAASPPVPVSGISPVSVPLAGRTSFTPAAGTLNLLSVEASGNLQRVGTAPCTVTVVPYVNGNARELGEGPLTVRAFAPTAEEPSGLAPVAGATGPLGLLSPGATQAIAVKVIGSADCTPASSVTVAVAVTQFK